MGIAPPGPREYGYPGEQAYIKGESAVKSRQHGGCDRVMWVDVKDDLPRPSPRRSGAPPTGAGGQQAEAVRRTTGLERVNPRSQPTWERDLPAGEAVEMTYTCQGSVRN